MGTLKTSCEQRNTGIERDRERKRKETERVEWECLPRVDTSDLGRSFVTPTMLALLMCLGENFEQFLTNSHRLSFVADHFSALRKVE